MRRYACKSRPVPRGVADHLRIGPGHVPKFSNPSFLNSFFTREPHADGATDTGEVPLAGNRLHRRVEQVLDVGDGHRSGLDLDR